MVATAHSVTSITANTLGTCKSNKSFNFIHSLNQNMNTPLLNNSIKRGVASGSYMSARPKSRSCTGLYVYTYD